MPALGCTLVLTITEFRCPARGRVCAVSCLRSRLSDALPTSVRDRACDMAFRCPTRGRVCPISYLRCRLSAAISAVVSVGYRGYDVGLQMPYPRSCLCGIMLTMPALSCHIRGHVCGRSCLRCRPSDALPTMVSVRYHACDAGFRMPYSRLCLCGIMLTMPALRCHTRVHVCGVSCL